MSPTILSITNFTDGGISNVRSSSEFGVKLPKLAKLGTCINSQIISSTITDELLLVGTQNGSRAGRERKSSSTVCAVRFSCAICFFAFLAEFKASASSWSWAILLWLEGSRERKLIMTALKDAEAEVYPTGTRWYPIKFGEDYDWLHFTNNSSYRITLLVAKGTHHTFSREAKPPSHI